MSGTSRRRSDVDQCISAQLPFSLKCFGPTRYELGFSLIRAKSSLLRPSQIPNHEPPDTMVSALMRIFAKRSAWHRSLESWEVPDGSRRVQFDSLVNHLFAQYEMPAFMPGTWLRSDFFERCVFLHVAKGLSVRSASCSVRCSRKMVPHFMNAPADLTVRQAFRWAQVFALGGDKQLARAIVSGRLHTRLLDEPFWNDTIAFLTRESVGPVEANEIIEFAHRQRFQTGTTAYRLAEYHEPLQPDFSLVGRNLRWLRRHMANWQEDLGISAIQFLTRDGWEPLDIGGFERDTADGKWVIDQITSPAELKAEGGIMQHCAYSYLSRCRRQLTSIWSLKRCSREQNTRVLTIEVSPHRRSILQVRGKRNRLATAGEWNLVKAWARTENLTVPSGRELV